MMRLSDNFYLNEFTKSNTATRLDIDNTPNEEEVANLTFLANRVLQPVRIHFGRVVHISSGFRCTALNKAVGSNSTSQHQSGEAADIEIYGLDNYEVACWIRDNCDFDQLILEFYTGIPDSGWIHVSSMEKGNRGECLTITKGLVRNGLVKDD